MIASAQNECNNLDGPLNPQKKKHFVVLTYCGRETGYKTYTYVSFIVQFMSVYCPASQE